MCTIQILCGPEYWVDSGYCERGPNLTHHKHYDDLIWHDIARRVYDWCQVLNGHRNTGAQGIEGASFKFLNVGVVRSKAFREN